MSIYIFRASQAAKERRGNFNINQAYTISVLNH